MSRDRLPPPGRIGERGSAVVAVLVLLTTTLLVVVGARLFGGAAALQLRCQGDAVRAIGSSSTSGCGGGAERAFLGRAPAAAEPSAREEPRPLPRPSGRAGLFGWGAAARLAPLFEIVEPDVQRNAENQVTEDEFDAIVDLYDAIRDERTSLKPTETALEYWDAIVADLSRILQTEGGRALLDRLANHRTWTVLEVGFVRNADGEEVPELGLDTSNAMAEYDGLFGYVTYAPGEWVRIPGVDTELNPWAVWRSDVALYHELVHVLDYLDGTGDPRIAEEQDIEFSAMEYRAIGIGPWQDVRISENAYRAARRAIAERGAGAATGDADMPDRPRYVPLLPPTEPPGPQPPPDPDDRFWHLDDR